jgi:hypothetical protein
MADNLNDNSVSRKEWILRILPVDYEYNPPTTPGEFSVAVNHVANAMAHYGVPLSYGMPALSYFFDHAFNQTGSQNTAVPAALSGGQQPTAPADGIMVSSSAASHQTDADNHVCSNTVLDDWSWGGLPMAVDAMLTQRGIHPSPTSDVDEVAATALKQPSIDAVFPAVTSEYGLRLHHDHNRILVARNSNNFMDPRRVGTIIAEFLDSHNMLQRSAHNSTPSDSDGAENTEGTQGPAIHTVPAGIPILPSTGAMATGVVLTRDDVPEPDSSNVLFES